MVNLLTDFIWIKASLQKWLWTGCVCKHYLEFSIVAYFREQPMDSGMTGVGKGRGCATNVPERALIDQVRLRPLLYDKNVKDYRKVNNLILWSIHILMLHLFILKPGASDSAWNDVAAALDTTGIHQLRALFKYWSASWSYRNALLLK